MYNHPINSHALCFLKVAKFAKITQARVTQTL